jgi:hypothetical protein
MTSSIRHKRPELDRFGPIRALGGAPGSPRDGAPPAEARTRADASPLDTISRAVEGAYGVIEDYMRQGQGFARTTESQRESTGPSAPDPRRLTERMFQSASDLAALWLDYAQATLDRRATSAPSGGTGPSGPAAPHVGGFDIGGTPAGPSAPSAPSAPASRVEATRSPALDVPSISIDIVSKRRAEVTVELKPGALGAALAAHDLRSGYPGLTRISGVTAEPKPSENRIAIGIEVPDVLPAGIYSGLIVDTVTNLPQGTLSVRVFD